MTGEVRDPTLAIEVAEALREWLPSRESSESPLSRRLALAMLGYNRVRLGTDPAPQVQPIPMLLFCPRCGKQHVDAPEPENGWTNPPHKSHACHGCDLVWRPADVPTVGVERITTRGSGDTFEGAAPQVGLQLRALLVGDGGDGAEDWIEVGPDVAQDLTQLLARAGLGPRG